MEVTNSIHPSVNAKFAKHSAAEPSTSTQSSKSDAVQNLKPVSDGFTISRENLLIARQIMTQQVEFALNLGRSNPISPGDSRPNFDSQRETADNLVQKVQQTIDNEKDAGSDHDDDENHHRKVLGDVSARVSLGFERSVSTLTNLGIMDGAVADDMAKTQQQVNRAVDQNIPQPAESPTNTGNMVSGTTELSAASADRSLSTQIEITTRNGDVVTINLEKNQQATVGRLDAGNTSLDFTEASVSSQLSISVQGDINKKEAQSIKKVVEQIGEIAQKLFNGKVGAALEKLGDFKINSRQLVGIAMNMNSSISYQAVGVYQKVSQIPTATLPQQATTPASTGIRPASNELIQAPPPNEPPLTASAPAAAAVTDAVQESVPVISEIAESNDLENPFAEIRKLFQAIVQLSHSGVGALNSERHDFIEKLFESMVDHAEHENEIDDDD